MGFRVAQKGGCPIPEHILHRRHALLMIGTGVMSALLEHGADASATEPNRGATALHLAATNPQARGAAAALLKHGADAWAKDKAGDTPTDRHHQCVAEARTTGASRAVEADVEAKADAAQAASEPAPEGSTAGAGGGEDETPAAALLLLPDIDPAARRGDALRRADWTAIGTGHFTEGKHELAVQHLYCLLLWSWGQYQGMQLTATFRHPVLRPTMVNLHILGISDLPSEYP